MGVGTCRHKLKCVFKRFTEFFIFETILHLKSYIVADLTFGLLQQPDNRYRIDERRNRL